MQMDLSDCENEEKKMSKLAANERRSDSSQSDSIRRVEGRVGFGRESWSRNGNCSVAFALLCVACG